VAQTTQGPFSYNITWDNPDVDLDLLVIEPQAILAGPSEGSVSANAFSSADSYLSGQATETYTANAELARGNYEVFVRYAGCRYGLTTCGTTNVSVFRFDPTAGDTQSKLIGTRRMAATPALPSSAMQTVSLLVAAANTNNYADWLYASQVTRATLEDAGDNTPLSLNRKNNKLLIGLVNQ
jgi:hypothetical protein